MSCWSGSARTSGRETIEFLHLRASNRRTSAQEWLHPPPGIGPLRITWRKSGAEPVVGRSFRNANPDSVVVGTRIAL